MHACRGVCWTNWLASGANWVLHEILPIVEMWANEYKAQILANVSEAEAVQVADELVYAYIFPDPV